MDHDTLKTRHRDIRDGMPESLNLRVHRALSWLKHAEQTEDADGRFIFLWIAFNAAYANEGRFDQDARERTAFMSFIDKLIDLDRQELLYDVIWEAFPKSIRMFVDNPYVFHPFWRHQMGQLSETDWQEAFDRSRRAAHQALARKDTKTILNVLFERLYVLRNQLMHGAATWNSSVNREQVKDGAAIMGRLVPAVIHVMMENPNALWGDPCYPVVNRAEG
jgi:hypothetical protein